MVTQTTLPRFYLAVERWSNGEPLFVVRDRNGPRNGFFAGLTIKQAMVTAAHHNRVVR